jgi:hypothetical protein
LVGALLDDADHLRDLDETERPSAPGPNALTGRSSSAEGTSNASFEPTSIITTSRDLIEGSAFGSPSPAVTDLMALNVRRQDVLGGLIHEYRDAA